MRHRYYHIDAAEIPPLAGFTGKERDVAETGYDYFGARYYDSWAGRWLSVDPMAEKYPGWSPYCYAKDNALILIDPDGRRVYYHDERLRLVYRDMASKSLEFRLILQMYSQKDVKGNDIGPDLHVGSGPLGTFTEQDIKRQLYGDTEVKIVGDVLDNSKITIDWDKCAKDGKDVKETISEEMGHAFEAAFDIKRYEKLTDQETKKGTLYDDRQTEKDAKTKAFQILKQYEKNNKKEKEENQR